MPFRKKQPKTAFVLSGGGSRGSYQIGVWQALRELGIKPDIVVGTSVGSINGAMIALDEFENAQSLWQELTTDEIFDINTNNLSSDKINAQIMGISMEEVYGYAREIVIGGAGSSGMLKLFDKYINEDKFRKLKVEYGLVTALMPTTAGVKLFTEDIPYGQLHQYINASASCFPATQMCQIDDKKYVDGGYADNMPVGMALEKGAERIIAIDLKAVGKVHKDDIQKAKETTDFTYIHSHFDLGNFLSFNPVVATDNLRYGYLDGLKAFGKLDGQIYAFKKNSFDKESLIYADAAAFIFRLDGKEIYTPKTLNQMLSGKILDAQVALHKQPINISSITDKIDRTILTVFIAEDIKNNGNKSKFLKKLVRDVLSKELKAAKYILDNNLLYT